MVSVSEKLSELAGAAFEAEGLPRELGRVNVSDRPDLAQFQCNGALAAAKLAGKNPRQIAENIAGRLRREEILSKVDIAGPGFINLTVTDDCLSAHLAQVMAEPRAGIAAHAHGETMILDYGGPNIAKAMHVGHLRASIIGDTLRRICKFAGYSALGDVHMGDWGLPMGQILSELEIRHPDWPYFDPGFTGPYPSGSPVSMADLEVIYPQASKACKEDEARLERARRATLELQNGRPGYRALWQHFFNVSVAGMKKNFEALDVHFDLWKGEACVHDLIAPMVEDLKKNGWAKEDDGALVVPVAKNDDKKEMPPLILIKRDGAVMYSTTDMATLVDRMQEYGPEKIVYVVDQRQSLHFEQLFRAAYKGGIVPDRVELAHAGFGTMNGPDGKPFKTREGGVLKLEDLIEMGVEKARARLTEAGLATDMDPAEYEDVARKIAIAAIKFADLQNNRAADYIFDLDRMTAFEGKTGPYLLYQAVRIKSLLRKADNFSVPPDVSLVLHDVDRPLALLLTELPDHFAVALRSYSPHILCDYAYRLAQAFSSFYGNCHILSEEDVALRESRLALCALTYRQLDLVLGLLGISIPERM